jgi:hypothetical protein
MTTIQLLRAGHLAEEAERAGLLSASSLEKLPRDQLRA